MHANLDHRPAEPVHDHAGHDHHHEHHGAHAHTGHEPHHGGHGVGLSVFDDPHVIPTDEQRLESWMVLALEPGVYLPGLFGVRRENLFLVTPDGGVELTQAVSRPLDARAQAGWNV